MSKRQAQDEQNGDAALKQGERPVAAIDDAEMGQFEDDFEDEFESEDEIMVAGADGMPDDEEGDQGNAEGMSYFRSFVTDAWLTPHDRQDGSRPTNLHSRPPQARCWSGPGSRSYDVRNAPFPGSALAVSLI